MRRWLAAPALFAAVVAAATFGSTSRTAAQDAKKIGSDPVDETIITGDGVSLQAKFYAATKGGGDAPVVILLYSPATPGDKTLAGRDMTKGDWDGLARRLSAEGYHVIRFDWRGHGKSLSVDRTKFWNITVPGTAPPNPYTGGYNQKLAGPFFNPKTAKPTIDDKEFKAKYLPVLVNDLAAVRLHLDQKNDSGQVNTSTVYVVGERDAAAVAMLWLAGEWNRPAFHPNLLAEQIKFAPDPRVSADPPAGETVAGAVWLSASRPSVLPEGTVQQLASKYGAKIREGNPMLYLYGEKDKAAGERNAKFYYNEVLVAEGKNGAGLFKLPQTFMKPVPGTAASGIDLLGKNDELKTEDTILNYLKARQDVRKAIVRKDRKYNTPYFINLPALGVYPDR